jgi:hypothetical protein
VFEQGTGNKEQETVGAWILRGKLAFRRVPARSGLDMVVFIG